MADEARFDWGAILRASAIIIAGTAAFGFIVPVVITVAFKLGNTGPVSGHVAFTWGYWAVAWGLTVWQGAWMLREVHERIIDDMLVTSILVALVLLIVKIVIALVFEPINSEGDLRPIFTAFDAGGALILLVVALIGARANRY